MTEVTNGVRAAWRRGTALLWLALLAMAGACGLLVLLLRTAGGWTALLLGIALLLGGAAAGLLVIILQGGKQ